MNTFFLVWNEPTGYTKYRHDNKESAEKEAIRMAREHGGEFHVLAAVSAFKKTDIQEKRFNLENLDPIPF